MRHIFKKKLLIFPFIFILAALCIYLLFVQSHYTSNQLPVKQLNQTVIGKNEIGDYISNNHNYWNEELCWGRYEHYNFKADPQNFQSYLKNLSFIISSTDDPNLKADFLHIQELLTSASQTKDVNDLIQVHRIFHDLDVKFNGYVSTNYFAVTKYGERH